MSLNPVEHFIKMFWPSKEVESKELIVRYRLQLYFNFFCSLVMLYSIIKWSRADYNVLVYSAIFGFVVAIGNSFYVKTGPSPVVSANIFLLGAFPHGVNMIFSLGGLSSAHIFWMPALVCIAYLLGNKKSGLFWFACGVAVVLLIIYCDRHNVPLPQFEFTEKGKIVDTYSGYLLPMLIIWLAQSYSYRIREQSFQEAMAAQQSSADLAENSQGNYERLGIILDEAKHTCETLAKSTESLASNLLNMNDSSNQISAGVQEQVSASADIGSTVEQTVETLEQSSSMVQEMRDFTDQTEKNVTSTANSMQAATQSMEKIKERFTNIEGVISVISDIASQTNLLALNASIEAARAGDKGRGFAVVADEVRSLSIRCDESAREITETIKQAAVDVAEGADLVMGSASVLNQTTTSVRDVSANIRSLNDVIVRLNDNMQGVANATQKVSDVSDSNAMSAESLLVATNDLTIMSEELCGVSDTLQQVVNNS